jgi:hypothetical protein
MDHSFRNIRDGLTVIGEVRTRGSRDEFNLIVDPYALEAIKAVVKAPVLFALQGWSRSYYTLDAHVKAIEAYNLPKLPEPTDTVWNQTKQYVSDLFKRFNTVECSSYKDFDSVKWIASSSAGYGYTGHKGDHENYRIAKRTAVTISEMLNHNPNYVAEAVEQSTPDVAFTRTQLCQVKVKTKVRNVWGEAFHYVLLEGLFAQPLVEYFMTIDSFYFIGRDPLFAVPALIEDLLSKKDYIYMFDWTAFDASVQEWEIRFAFQLLESILKFPSTVESHIWHFIIELFIYRKIAAPNGTLYLKTQGIPSGSCFTNIIGSIVNFVRLQYMFKKMTNQFVIAYTHGDDSLVGIDSAQFVHFKQLEAIAAQFNWNLSAAKSSFSRRAEGTTFLSRTVREGQNTREDLTCLRMLLFPEFPVQSGALSALRAKSIFHDAGSNSETLLTVYLYLKTKYGVADDLPDEFKAWNLIEYEARKVSYSTYVM